MHSLIAELYPICRSLTGNGVRETLARIAREIPLVTTEVPSGTPVLDWTVPMEWNIRDAYIANERGERVVDFQQSNLHVVGYSTPVRQTMTLAELRPHLRSLPDHPDWIPYHTTPYREGWGFCLTQRTLDALPDGTYEVVIDSTLAPGSLTYAECVLPGSSTDEVLVSTHICHPSLCNDNLSGVAVAVALARELATMPRRLTYRFVFAPTTLGSIAWLSRNEETTRRVRHGLVLAGVGDPGAVTYKRTRRGGSAIDRAMQHVLRRSGEHFTIRDFVPYGYDERQYCSPGYDLPVGCLMRTPYAEYPQYHTSADNLDFVRPAAVEDTLGVCRKAFEILEHDARFLNALPKGEPQLGRRGLLRGGAPTGKLPDHDLALLWLLSSSDGKHSLLDIAERAGMSFSTIREAADGLRAAGLLVPAPTEHMPEYS